MFEARILQGSLLKKIVESIKDLVRHCILSFFFFWSQRADSVIFQRLCLGTWLEMEIYEG